MRPPALVVFSTLFPHPGRPNAGLFIRERMFRVGQRLPLTVISPRPWSPLDGLIRRFRPHYRPSAPEFENQQGFEVYYPRFFSLPGMLKFLDGWSMALGSLPRLWRLRRAGRLNVLDAHFAYPDGYAATRLNRWLGVPVTITLRGTEIPHSRNHWLRPQMLKALRDADQVFSVSTDLKNHLVALGASASKIKVVGNGVDLDKFYPLCREEMRKKLGLPDGDPVLVSVGGLVERKGFHRVIDCLPPLRQTYPGLRYLVVGGASAEGDMSLQLRRQVTDLGLEEVVHFLGPMAPDRLKEVLSAADIFVLATRNEGWANVFLEAMACGLPVVTTRVGGNAEVVCEPALGLLVPFGDPQALTEAIGQALAVQWDRAHIIDYARRNTWKSRIEVLEATFRHLAAGQNDLHDPVQIETADK